LTPASKEKILPLFSSVTVKLGSVLIESERPSTQALFPLAPAVISLVRESADGDGVEVGLVGREGFATLSALVDPARQLDRGILQAEGEVLRIESSDLRRLFETEPDIRRTLMQFINAFTMQVSQTALCNRLHSVEQRLARWLLMMRERGESDELRLTQEFLAHMLGTRIAGVNEAIRVLDRSGVIRNARQKVTILDENGLEAISCECYRAIRTEFERLENGAGAVPSSH
jgi:CRP-like cAMP-binding protein